MRLLIEKIVVGEKSQKYSRTAEQEIYIYYRDIGLMDTPVEPSEAREAELDIWAGETFETTRTALTAEPEPAA